MREIFLKKLIKKEFSNLTTEELRLIVNNTEIFPLTNKDIKALEKIINGDSLEENKDKVAFILQEGLPSAFVILSNLDKQGVKEGPLEIDFRKALVNNLNKMNNLQLCIFVDKLLKISKEEKLRFFKNKDFSLHEINGVISKSLGLSLVFEIFKQGKAKVFTNIDYNKIDKKLMVETINNQVVRYLYILEIISNVVLATDEDKIFGTKINKTIRERAEEYTEIIRKEKSAIKATGVEPKQSWTFTLCNMTNITVEEDDEYFDEEEDDEY